MPRARQRHRLRALPARLALGRPRAHPPRPVLVVAVRDEQRERRAERAAVAQAGEHLDPVLLDLLPRAAAVALLAAREVGVDRVAVEHEPGRQAADDRDERRAVRLARCCQPKRHGGKPTAPRITSTGAGMPVQSSNDAAPCATSTSSPTITWRPPRAPRRGRRLRIRKVDERLARAELDEHVVSLEVAFTTRSALADVGRPVAAPREDARASAAPRGRRARRRRRRGSTGRSAGSPSSTAASVECPGSARPRRRACSPRRGRVTASCRSGRLVRGRHVRAGEAGRGEPAHGRLEPSGATSAARTPSRARARRRRRSASRGDSERRRRDGRSARRAASCREIIRQPWPYSQDFS